MRRAEYVAYSANPDGRSAQYASLLRPTFSNQKFTVAEFDFQAIADAVNNIGTISLTE